MTISDDSRGRAGQYNNIPPWREVDDDWILPNDVIALNWSSVQASGRQVAQGLPSLQVQLLPGSGSVEERTASKRVPDGTRIRQCWIRNARIFRLASGGNFFARQISLQQLPHIPDTE